MLKKTSLTFFILCLFTLHPSAQSLPLEMNITPDGHLVTGGNVVEGLYNVSEVHRIDFTIDEPNWFQIMDGTGGPGPGGTPGELVMGTLAFDNLIVLDSVMIGIKGATSDFANDSEKKSFKVEIDALKDQELMGYDNLNLNGGYDDHSSMREVLYYDQTRSFAPALKASFIDLYINGDYWGPYSNIQQIEGTYINEWFLNNDGTRWRAIKPGGFGGPGGPFGTGFSTLNDLGSDSTDYNDFYTLKKTDSNDPWATLINACDELNNLPSDQLYDELKYSIDVDRALWFLAQEIIFTDEDSYVWKGGMDYYVYHDTETGRIIPLEVDGNSAMLEDFFDWSPFYNQNDDRFPLMNRLFANDELRQRYLAHVRVVLEDQFNPDNMGPRIDEFEITLDQRVQNDPKKIYSYNQFTNGVDVLRTFIENRYNYLNTHPEVNQQGLEISNLLYTSANGINMPPEGGQAVTVTVDIIDAQNDGINKVQLYYASGYQGAFERVEMTDTNNDGNYEGSIPGFTGSSFVRYYVEAISNDNANTASYFPKGAEHDVFIYQVNTGSEMISDDIAINEVMASNNITATDEAGEFDDWVELYNNTNAAIDLTGYFLTDDENTLLKWELPDGTMLDSDAYLIVWADNDENQGPLHTNFKLSAGGESVLLIDPTGNIVNRVDFGEQITDSSYSRIPNGTGDFTIKTPTHGLNNELTISINEQYETAFRIYPNPTGSVLNIEMNQTGKTALEIINLLGQSVLETTIDGGIELNLSGLNSGTYFLKIGEVVERLVVQK